MADWTIVSGGQRDALGEGVLWSARDNAVYWVDILAMSINRLALADMTTRRWQMPEPIGWLVERAEGGFIAGLCSGFVELSRDFATVTPIGDPEPDLPGNRMNDGKADMDGAIWCGTMDMAEEEARGSLYRLTPDRRWHCLDRGYRVPNGPAFSLDGQFLYHSDTALRTVYRFTRTGNGGIENREPFIAFSADDGYPDGMTVDAEGGLWIAHWGGGRVSRYDPSGSFDRSIYLPCTQPTNVTFAGPDATRMFVTSAITGLVPNETDGALFEVSSGARGVEVNLFAG